MQTSFTSNITVSIFKADGIATVCPKIFYLSDNSPSRVTYIGIACPSLRFGHYPIMVLLHPWPYPQVATPEKCYSLKFRCCSISLSLVATPVGTILCSVPSQATIWTIAGTSSHETGFCHLYLPKACKGENKISCMRVLFNFNFQSLIPH